MPFHWFDHEKRKPAHLSKILSSDCKMIESLTTTYIGIMIEIITSFTAAIIIGLILEWRVALIVSAIIPVLLFIGVLKMKFMEGSID